MKYFIYLSLLLISIIYTQNLMSTVNNYSICFDVFPPISSNVKLCTIVFVPSDSANDSKKQINSEYIYESVKNNKIFVYLINILSEKKLGYSFKCYDSSRKKVLFEEYGMADLNDECDESIEIPVDARTGVDNMKEVQAICYSCFDKEKSRRIGFEFDSSFSFMIIKDYFINEDKSGIWTCYEPIMISNK